MWSLPDSDQPTLADAGESALVTAAQRGSDEALEPLYRRHWPWARRAAYLVVPRWRGGRGHRAGGRSSPRSGALDRFDRRRPFGALAAPDRGQPGDRLGPRPGAAPGVGAAVGVGAPARDRPHGRERHLARVKSCGAWSLPPEQRAIAGDAPPARVHARGDRLGWGFPAGRSTRGCAKALDQPYGCNWMGRGREEEAPQRSCSAKRPCRGRAGRGSAGGGWPRGVQRRESGFRARRRLSRLAIAPAVVVLIAGSR